MAIAMAAGLDFSLFATLYRRFYGYDRLTVRGWRPLFARVKSRCASGCGATSSRAGPCYGLWALALVVLVGGVHGGAIVGQWSGGAVPLRGGAKAGHW
jgi:hypothetical protein